MRLTNNQHVQPLVLRELALLRTLGMQLRAAQTYPQRGFVLRPQAPGAAIASVVPAGVVSEQHRKLAEPRSGPKK